MFKGNGTVLGYYSIVETVIALDLLHGADADSATDEQVQVAKLSQMCLGLKLAVIASQDEHLIASTFVKHSWGRVGGLTSPRCTNPSPLHWLSTGAWA